MGVPTALGDENGVLILYGLFSVLLVLIAAYRTRAARYSVLVGTAVGVCCVIGLYLIIALISLLTVGTNGFQFATWLIFVAVGLLPVVALGLVEGFAASLIFRLLA